MVTYETPVSVIVLKCVVLDSEGKIQEKTLKITSYINNTATPSEWMRQNISAEKSHVVFLHVKKKQYDVATCDFNGDKICTKNIFCTVPVVLFT